jgi:uncharacterized protein YbjT (DUF2867 family)
MGNGNDNGAGSTVLLAGATGLVGSNCLRLLLTGTAFERVVAVVRRPLPAIHDRLQALVTEFEALAGHPPVPGRAGLCALGTTMNKAGSKEAFRRADHDAVLSFARWARAGGAGTFVVVSSAGASPKSRTFYLRVKGETERDLEAIGFPRLVILRPGLLLGERSEMRLGEAIGQALLRRVNPVLRGPLRPYRAIPAERVAAAMVAAARVDEPGRFIWHNEQIEAAAGVAPMPRPPVTSVAEGPRA